MLSEGVLGTDTRLDLQGPDGDWREVTLPSLTAAAASDHGSNGGRCQYSASSSCSAGRGFTCQEALCNALQAALGAPRHAGQPSLQLQGIQQGVECLGQVASGLCHRAL